MFVIKSEVCGLCDFIAIFIRFLAKINLAKWSVVQADDVVGEVNHQFNW